MKTKRMKLPDVVFQMATCPVCRGSDKVGVGVIIQRGWWNICHDCECRWLVAALQFPFNRKPECPETARIVETNFIPVDAEGVPTVDPVTFWNLKEYQPS